eukprot:5679737-Pleurochrysis_carterae.AAC.2
MASSTFRPFCALCHSGGQDVCAAPIVRSKAAATDKGGGVCEGARGARGEKDPCGDRNAEAQRGLPRVYPRPPGRAGVRGKQLRVAALSLDSASTQPWAERPIAINKDDGELVVHTRQQSLCYPAKI